MGSPSTPAVGISFRASDDLCPNGVSDLVRYAVLAERHGFHDVDAADHVLLADDHDAHPGAAWDWGPDSLWPDPLVLLAAIAGATSRIRMTTSILVAPLRPAVVIAKMAATVDALSDGRLTLGIGSGWLRAEFDAAGMPFKGRTARMEDLVGACRALWTTSPATFHSDTVSFERMWCHPQPCQPHGIPILLAGGPTAAVAERVARLAEGWLPMGRHHDELATGIAYLRRTFAAAGRDPDALLVRAPVPEAIVRAALRADDPEPLRDELAALSALGVTHAKIYARGLVTDASEVEPVLAWLSATLELPPPAPGAR